MATIEQNNWWSNSTNSVNSITGSASTQNTIASVFSATTKHEDIPHNIQIENGFAKNLDWETIKAELTYKNLANIAQLLFFFEKKMKRDGNLLNAWQCWELRWLDNIARIAIREPTDRTLKTLKNNDIQVTGNELTATTIHNVNETVLLHGFLIMYEKWRKKKMEAKDIDRLYPNIYNYITITKPVRYNKQNRRITDTKKILESQNFWWGTFLHTLRRWDAHKWIVRNPDWKPWIYINYPNCIEKPGGWCKEDLECFIQRDFFYNIFFLIQRIDRRAHFADCKLDNLNFSKGYDRNREKISINLYKKKEKTSIWYTTDKKEIAERAGVIRVLDNQRDTIFEKEWNITLKNGERVWPKKWRGPIPNWAGKLLDEFFKDGKHKRDKKNFRTVLSYMTDTNITKIHQMVQCNLSRLMDEKLYDTLLKTKLETSKSIANMEWESTPYALIYNALTSWDNYKNWLIFSSTNDLENIIKKILDMCYPYHRISRSEFSQLVDKVKYERTELETSFNEIDLWLEHVQNYLRYLFIAEWYLNDPSFVPVTPHSIIPENEHIRNAIAHQNVFMIPGVDKIILWDPTQDSANQDWEKTYDINDLFEQTYNKYNMQINLDPNAMPFHEILRRSI